MKIRFLADNDLRKAILRGAVRQAPDLDFRSAQSARLDGVPDLGVLALAADEERILVSHDFQTMPETFGKFTYRVRSPGVLLIARTCRWDGRLRVCCLSGRPHPQRIGLIG